MQLPIITDEMINSMTKEEIKDIVEQNLLISQITVLAMSGCIDLNIVVDMLDGVLSDAPYNDEGHMVTKELIVQLFDEAGKTVNATVLKIVK